MSINKSILKQKEIVLKGPFGIKKFYGSKDKLMAIVSKLNAMVSK